MSPLKALYKLLLQLARRKRPDPAEPRDPFAYVRVPLKKGPNTRSGAVALIEPDGE